MFCAFNVIYKCNKIFKHVLQDPGKYTCHPVSTHSGKITMAPGFFQYFFSNVICTDSRIAHHLILLFSQGESIVNVTGQTFVITD